MSKKKITTVYTMERAEIEEAIMAAMRTKYQELNDEHEEKLFFLTNAPRGDGGPAPQQLARNATLLARIEFVEERE